MASDIEIREARIEDADVLGDIHVLAWQRAYRGLMPDDYLDGLSVAERREMWKQTLERDGRSIRALVALRAKKVCGFAVVGGVRDDDPHIGELYAINLDPDVWRQGVGRELVASCIDTLRDLGYGEAILWVLIGNDRARRFYEALGWRRDETEKHGSLMGVDTHEIRYRIEL